jgi:hypothetical protein
MGACGYGAVANVIAVNLDDLDPVPVRRWSVASGSARGPGIVLRRLLCTDNDDVDVAVES